MLYFASTFCTVCSPVAWITSIYTSAVNVMTLFIIDTLPTWPVAMLAKHSTTTLCRWIITYSITQTCNICFVDYYLSSLIIIYIARILQIEIVDEHWVNSSNILLWSHWVCFHPSLHPPIQCPVTLSHFPEITQCLLQYWRQFSPNWPCELSTLIRVLKAVNVLARWKTPICLLFQQNFST